MLHALVALFKKGRIDLIEPHSSGPDKISTIIRMDRTHMRIDFFLATREEYPFAVLYGTGSKSFNIEMRTIAKRKGMLLNQRGLFVKCAEGKCPVKCNNEKEIFDKLGMLFVSPEDRL